MKEKRPFIIWTLQRTGGTNLARRLFERSGLLDAANRRGVLQDIRDRIPDQWKLHEPFNFGPQGRVFGHVSEEWLRTRDRRALNRAMAEICGLHLPFKHCVEMVPWEVTEALADATCREGYAHLFLYRKKPVNRLLSLHFAQLSGIWGPELKGKNELNEKIFAQALPVAKMVEHESLSVQQLSKTWQYLCDQGASPQALAFEDIFQAESLTRPLQICMEVLHMLRLTRGKEEDRAFIAEIIGKGDQGTRCKYGSFAGVEKLEEALQRIPQFVPDPAMASLEVRSLNPDDSRLFHAAVDGFPACIELGRSFEIGGVVVLKEVLPAGSTLRLVQGDDNREIRWGIQSPVMARRFPESPNGLHARFKTGGLVAERNSAFEIWLDDGKGHHQVLFRIVTSCKSKPISISV